MYSLIAAQYSELFPAEEQRCRFLLEETAGNHKTRILDAGCANGDLSFQLADTGLSVTGIDLSSEMIQAAEERLVASSDRYKNGKMTFHTRSMTDLSGLGRFDAVVCFGNTLPHLPSADHVQDFFIQGSGLLMPGGKLIIQIINFDILAGKSSFEFPEIKTSGSIFNRRYERRADGRVDFIISLIDLKDGSVLSDSVPLLPLSRKDMLKRLENAGFKDCELYGDYDRNPTNGDEFATIYSASVE